MHLKGPFLRTRVDQRVFVFASIPLNPQPLCSCSPAVSEVHRDFRSSAAAAGGPAAGSGSAGSREGATAPESKRSSWTHPRRSAETCRRMDIAARWVWSAGILLRLSPEMHSHRLLSSAPPQSCSGDSALPLGDFKIKLNA